MLTEQQKRVLDQKENSFFMLWVYKRLPKEMLTEEERFILCRDCFRLTVYNLTIISTTLSLGMFLEFILLAALPTSVFIKRWKAYLNSKILLNRQRSSAEK